MKRSTSFLSNLLTAIAPGRRSLGRGSVVECWSPLQLWEHSTEANDENKEQRHGVRPFVAFVGFCENRDAQSARGLAHSKTWRTIERFLKNPENKRVFASMMLLFTLADTGEKEALPLITIPA
jgi:hypothetical protein